MAGEERRGEERRERERERERERGGSARAAAFLRDSPRSCAEKT